MAKDYYDVLGISKNATQEEIKKAFRKLAHEHHPDKSNGNADKFKEINEAYQTIGNEQKRKQYDQFGSSFGQGGAGGFNYQDFARSQGGNPFGQGRGGFSQGGAHFDFGDLGDMGDLGDLFGSFFGGAQTRTKVRRGDDVEIDLAIDFEEAVFGVEKTIVVQKKILCDRCSGNGAEPGSQVTNCKTCGGTGRVNRVQQTIFGNIQTQSVCPECHGDGKKFDKKCTKCHGNGVTYGSEEIKVKIPAGIEDGQSIKLSGRGEPSPKGEAGDLYIQIKVRHSRIFNREGNDILSQHHISIKQAILGDKIDVETVDGPVKLKIPEGTQSHTKFKLHDKGVPYLRSHGRGDHVVEVIVDIPKSINKKQKTLIDELDI